MSADLLTERLLRVIDEGRRTATYKLALLVALIDAVAARPGTERIPTRVLAEEVLRLYFDQSRPFVAADGSTQTLRQIVNKQAVMLETASALRVKATEARCRSIGDVRRRLAGEYETAVDAIEDTLVRYPIPLLQVVGTRLVPFLYEADWPEGQSVRSLRREGRDAVRLLPGIADRLVVLGPLLRPLIELHWARDVATWSRIATEDDRLRTHLFGTDRVAFPKGLRDGLMEIQQYSCFYCGSRLTRRVEVDHFLAWSRWPNDAIENLVLADRCNGEKSDHLAAEVHVERWARHIDRNASALTELAEHDRWHTDRSRTVGLVTSTYQHVAPQTPLWVRAQEFVLSRGPIGVVVSTLATPPTIELGEPLDS